MKNEILASFWEHLEQLRWVLIRSLLSIAVGTILALFIYPHVFSFLTSPYLQRETEPFQRYKINHERVFNSGTQDATYQIPTGFVFENGFNAKKISGNVFKIAPKGFVDIVEMRPIDELIILSPAEGMVLAVKICLWIGLTLSSPFWIFSILQFISPALREQERRLLLPFLPFSAMAIGSGILFAYWITIPAANQYLLAFNQDLGRNLWSLGSYLNFTLTLLFANAVAFECFVILFFLVHFGIFSATSLQRKRRHVVVGSLIVAALLTPPDVLSQILLAVPLMIFYELAIIYSKFRSQKSEVRSQ